LIHSQVQDKSLIGGNEQLAVELFNESLKEIGVTKDQFPILTFIYSYGQQKQKIVAEELIKCWKEIFGVHCRLECLQFCNLFSKMLKGDFQIGTISWKSWINNAFYTLNAFEYRTNRVNFSKWEHEKYQKLICKAHLETVSEKRSHLLKNAEQLLIQECPVLPIHYEQYNFVQKKQLVDVFCSDSGNIDFKWASVSPD
jgi:oligopeptide transport system substrate-binding protein